MSRFSVVLLIIVVATFIINYFEGELPLIATFFTCSVSAAFLYLLIAMIESRDAVGRNLGVLIMLGCSALLAFLAVDRFVRFLML